MTITTGYDLVKGIDEIGVSGWPTDWLCGIPISKRKEGYFFYSTAIT